MSKIQLLFSPRRWGAMMRMLSFREKVSVAVLFAIIVGALLWWATSVFRALTVEIPQRGGQYSEGIVGQPLYINPLISQTSEADADLTKLIYNGLLRYNDSGDIVPDLAERYEVSEDQKIYTLFLRQDVLWHDGAPFSADDVVFTMSRLKDPSYQSPLRFGWQSVSVHKQDDHTVVFTLENPSVNFPYSLTVGILPKHIWENTTPERFTLSEHNLQPIGTGPYYFVDFQKDSHGNILSYKLRANEKYIHGAPYIEKMEFRFYPDPDHMIAAYNTREINGMHNVLPEKISLLQRTKHTTFHDIQLPRYFAVFFNRTKSIPLSFTEVRLALSVATDRWALINDVLYGKGKPMYSPFAEGDSFYVADAQQGAFDKDRAEKILDDAGWKRGEDGVRSKDGVRLSFTVHTIDTWQQIVATAEELATQWRSIGADVTIATHDPSDLTANIIRPREYDALLFGQELLADDPYFAWHSSQRADPGYNYAVLNDKNIDSLLESARTEPNKEKRAAFYHDFQKAFAKDVPAVFLNSPLYVYVYDQNLRGARAQSVGKPFDRFYNVNEWYVKTKRVQKTNNQ